MANGRRPNRQAEPAGDVREVLERLERIETRIEDLQTLVDLQLESTADIKCGLREKAARDTPG
jgi:hypothetical protein